MTDQKLLRAEICRIKKTFFFSLKFRKSYKINSFGDVTRASDICIAIYFELAINNSIAKLPQ